MPASLAGLVRFLTTVKNLWIDRCVGMTREGMEVVRAPYGMATVDKHGMGRPIWPRIAKG